MQRDNGISRTFDLFAEEEKIDSHKIPGWPSYARFPLNIDGYHVEDVVLNDLKTSNSPLIVTGFASLDRLIDFCFDAHINNPKIHTRLLIGQEPFPSRRETFSVNQNHLTEEVEAYWLSRGISLIYSAKIIHMVELLKQGKIEARYMPGSRRLHAKIYCGDEAATVGSSNFTHPGLKGQIEANARFEKDGRSNRYEELTAIAENYWILGRSYQKQLIELLEKLLRVVTWQEALARACAELLEGEWANKYIRGEYLSGSGSLWPSQKQGIAQALTILSTQGSVLIADATGAGKTKMGTYLIGAVQDHILRTGRMRQGKALMVCPPAAETNWKRESNLSGVALDPYSHGIFSNERTRGHDDTVDALRRAQILSVDEGHNFLNFKSQRTQKLLRNMADHVMLFTATPINKSVNDLLRMADMLGADNLSDSVIDAFKKMLGLKNINRQLTELELDELRTEIKRFTVRRTKRQLNKLVDREPDKYRDINGKQCRFPKHLPKIYKLNESDKDKGLANKIKSLADDLYGVTHFVKTIKMPEIFVKQGLSEEKYLQGRLLSAKRLARYMIMSCLRSSRAALIEHIAGTDEAVVFTKLKNFHKNQKSKGMVNQIKSVKDRIPENQLSIDLPDWLSNEKAHGAACANDLRIYRKIAELVEEMSDVRERSKADRLTNLLGKHDLILAFDSKPITLAIIHQYLKLNKLNKVLVAWGDKGTDKDKILKTFAFGSEEKGVIGLCSDSLAEAVNLQQASCLLHLDMPSVVRIAEQRAGRVDRMDSPHKKIEIWWPDDSEEFALTSDERFIERYDTVEKLLGSNMPLPESMRRTPRKTLTVKDMIEDVELKENVWDGIDDAFSSVRSLVEGESAIVSTAIYERYASIKERVLSRVSLVKSSSPWALFCITSGSFGSPIWVLLPSLGGQAETELSRIVDKLRKRLTDEIEDVSLDENSAKLLEHFLNRLSVSERSFLSKKKQRALQEMEIIIGKLKVKNESHKHIDHLLDVEKMLINPPKDKQPDWDEVASRWLDVIRPVWFEKLNNPRNKPLLLKDIRNELLKEPKWLISEIVEHFRRFPILPGPEERIKACIIGVS